MLVLSRKRDERVTCVLPDGRELSVAIVDIRGDKVRLGITAPASVMVHRKEVYLDIQRENRAAAQVPGEVVPAVRLGPAVEGGGATC
jgi:carbon storage regulator